MSVSTIKDRGFTLVELVIVIAVIAILAAISVVSYGSIKDRAVAATIYSGIKKVDDGLRLKAGYEHSATWPRDADIAGVNNPNFLTLINEGNAIKDYINELPTTGGITSWVYDNDNDNTTATAMCSTTYQTTWNAVVIVVSPVTTNVLKQLDQQIDNGDGLYCGRLRSGNASLTSALYQLSYTQDM